MGEATAALAGLTRGQRLTLTSFAPPYEEEYSGELLSFVQDGVVVAVSYPEGVSVPLAKGAAVRVLIQDLHPPLLFPTTIISYADRANRHIVVLRWPDPADVEPFLRRGALRLRLEGVAVQARRLDLPTRPLFDIHLADLSAGGAAIVCAEELRFGTKLVFDLDMLGLKNLTAAVVSPSLRTEGGFQHGVKFERLSGDAARVIRQYVYRADGRRRADEMPST